MFAVIKKKNRISTVTVVTFNYELINVNIYIIFQTRHNYICHLEKVNFSCFSIIMPYFIAEYLLNYAVVALLTSSNLRRHNSARNFKNMIFLRTFFDNV